MKKKILLSASLFHVLTDAAVVVTPTIFPILYSQGFLIKSYAQIGVLSNVGLFTTLIMQFLFVKLSVRREYRTLLLASGLGICASLALVPFAKTFGALLLFYVLLRLTSSFYHPIVVAWISKSRSGSGQELDDAMGIQSGSGNAGVILAYLTVGFLAQRWTWKTPLFSWSLFGLLLGILSFLALRGISTKTDAHPSLSAAAWIRSLIGVRRFIPGFFFGGMGWSITIFYGPSLLHHRFDIPMGRTGLFLALCISMGTITGYGYGVWSRALGRKNVFLISLSGAIVSALLIGLSTSRTLAVSGLVAFGGFLLMTYPSLHTFVGSTVRHEEQTLAFSWVSNIQIVSGALVSLASGFLSDAFGIQVPFILMGILTLAVFLFYLPRGAEFFGGTGKADDQGLLHDVV